MIVEFHIYPSVLIERCVVGIGRYYLQYTHCFFLQVSSVLSSPTPLMITWRPLDYDKVEQRREMLKDKMLRIKPRQAGGSL